MIHHTQSGQTIVEAIVVVSVVAVLVTGLIAGTTVALRSTQTGRVKSQAIKYAEEGLEYVRSVRDDQWSAFQLYTGTYCLSNDENGVVQALVSTVNTCDPNIITSDGQFTRSVNFSWDGQKMHVEVRVQYPDGPDTKEVLFQTYLTDWR